MGITMETLCVGIRAKKEHGHLVVLWQLWSTLAPFRYREMHSHTEVMVAGTHLQAGWEVGCSQHSKGLGTSF